MCESVDDYRSYIICWDGVSVTATAQYLANFNPLIFPSQMSDGIGFTLPLVVFLSSIFCPEGITASALT